MLKCCSDKRDMTEWNEWRKKNPQTDVNLQEAPLDSIFLGDVKLAGDKLDRAKFERANLRDAHCEGAQLWGAHLEHADLVGAHLEGAQLMEAHLQGADLRKSHLEGAELYDACLEGAGLMEAKMQKADLHGAYLGGACLTNACLEGANFHIVNVDGSTIIWKPKINRYSKKVKYTNFSGVAIDLLKIDPGTKQLLEYNIRRMNWEEWYKEHPRLKWVVKPFWLMSDYGLSTGRIVAVFLGFALVFAAIYYIWGVIAPPGIIENLFEVEDAAGKVVAVPQWLVPIRAVHFSVVIMTVGFTNMHANAHSFWAHIFVSLQMILGFVLLGALVTRFAVLFTAGGPAGKFAEDKYEKDKKQQRPPKIQRADDREQIEESETF